MVVQNQESNKSVSRSALDTVLYSTVGRNHIIISVPCVSHVFMFLSRTSNIIFLPMKQNKPEP